MEWQLFFREALQGGIYNVLIMAAIIIPIMMVMEVARDLELIERFSSAIAPAIKVFGMSKESALPMLVGSFFGIAYGGGMIIQSARSGLITWRDLFLVNIFLSVCHAVVEDTALFVAQGANIFIILGGRFLLAVIITLAISRMSWLRTKTNKSSAI